MKLLAELRRRNVIRMAGLYLVGAWLIVQVTETVLPAFDVPTWVLRAVIILLALGIIPALFFSWVFELTPQGLTRDDSVPAEESIAPQTARRLNRMIIAVLALGILYFGFDKFLLSPRRDAALVALMQSQNAARSSATADVAADEQSIAVLPFVNISSDKEQEYVSDGLSEELLNQLAKIAQLRVIARTSSFSFKGRDVDVATIAKTLNVAHVLEGSVRKSGNQLRITAQLIRASDSSHLWSQTYDRELADVFKVQDEISRKVVSALKVKLLPNQQIASTQRTSDTEAYDHYLLGMESERDGGRSAVERTLVYLKQAVALDPQYANAYALLAEAQGDAADYVDSPKQRAEAIARALGTVERSIALAPDLPDGYAVRGRLRDQLSRDRQGAQADFRQALALDANNVTTMINYAPALFFEGRREEALAMSHEATSIDPLSAEAWVGLGRQLAYAGKIPAARQALQRTLELNPENHWAAFVLGKVELREGNTDVALTYFCRAPEMFRLAGTAMVEHTRRNTQASRQALDELKTKYAIGFAYQIAQVHAWRGEQDQAFEWLNRAFDIHDAGMVRLRADPMFASLRGDPRFTALVEKLGLPK